MNAEAQLEGFIDKYTPEIAATTLGVLMPIAGSRL